MVEFVMLVILIQFLMMIKMMMMIVIIIMMIMKDNLKRNAIVLQDTLEIIAKQVRYKLC